MIALVKKWQLDFNSLMSTYNTQMTSFMTSHLIKKKSGHHN